MVDGMTKLPEAFGLEPVMVMAVPVLVNNNSALEVAVNVSSSARAHALKFFNSRLTVGELLGNCWGIVGLAILVYTCLNGFNVDLFEDLPPSMVVSSYYLYFIRGGATEVMRVET